MKRLAVAVLAACGGGEDDFDAPTCAPGEVRVEGTVDGIERTATATGSTQFAFINALSEDELGTLSIGFATDDELTLAWPDLVPNGGSVEARGTVKLSDIDLGSCETEGFPGIMVLSQELGSDVGKFRLSELRAGADCAAPALAGELRGCWQRQE